MRASKANILFCSALALSFLTLKATAVNANSADTTKLAAATGIKKNAVDHSAEFLEAQNLYRQGKYEDALAVVKKIKDAGLDDYQVRSHMAVNLFMTRPLIYPLAEARLAVKMNPRSAVANTNLGVLLQRNGERANAIEKYRAASTIDPSDWRAHVGIAQCLVVDGADGRIIAERELKLARAVTTGDTAARFYALGATYLVLRMYTDAEDCFRQMLKAKAGEANERTAQLGLLKAALGANNVKLISELAPVVLKTEAFDEKAALAMALPAAHLDNGQLTDLYTIVEKKFSKSEQFFYLLGRNFENSGQLNLAYKAYLQAVNLSGASSASVLSLIGNRAQVGELEEAKRLTAQYVVGKPAKLTGHNKDIFARSLQYAQQILSSEVEPTLHILNVQFSNIKCGCRIPVIELSLRSLPAVIFARVQDEKDPHACIIYDSKVSTSQAIVSIKRDDDKVEVLNDQPVKSLPELVKIVQAAADKPDKNIFTLWSFEPPPMELPK